MTARTDRLRRASLEAEPTISSERAEILTDVYQEELGKHSVPVMRALAFEALCRRKTLYLGPDELIVGEEREIQRLHAAETFTSHTTSFWRECAAYSRAAVSPCWSICG